jgi:hypothetical protein
MTYFCLNTIVSFRQNCTPSVKGNFVTTGSTGQSVSKFKYGFVRAKHRPFLSFCKDVLKAESVKTYLGMRGMYWWNLILVTFRTHKTDAFPNLGSPMWSSNKDYRVSTVWNGRTTDSRFLHRRTSEPRDSGLNSIYKGWIKSSGNSSIVLKW